MALHRYIIRVDPQGKQMTVDILDANGDSVPAFDSPQFEATALGLPLTITAQTDFCLASHGAYSVSCTIGGYDVAAGGAPKLVHVGDVPVLVVPDWVRELAAPAPATPTAADITYDPTASGLTSTDVQSAVDELASDITLP